MLRSILVKACLLSLVFLTSASVSNAAIVTESFTVIIADGGPFDGTTSTFGEFSYDDTFLDGFGDGFLIPGALGGSLTVDLTIFGQSFDEEDDVDFGFFPIPALDVEGDIPIFLDYIISEFGDNPVPITMPGVEFIGFISGFTPVMGGGFEILGTTDSDFFSAVPEPSSMVLLGALGGFGLLIRRKRGLKKTC